MTTKKHVSVTASNKALLLLLFALPLAVMALLACSTSDELLAYEVEAPDAARSLLPDTGAPDTLVTSDVAATPPPGCPGTVIPLVVAPNDPSKRVGSISGDTSKSSGEKSAFDSPTCGGASGKDVVYAITADFQGQAKVRLDAAFDALLYTRTTCAAAGTETGCKKTAPAVGGSGGKTEIIVPVQTNQTVYIIVDGASESASGSFKLDVEIGASACGDGLAQVPEQCDDGNTTAGDGCSDVCQLEIPIAAAGKCPGASYTLVGSSSGPAKKISLSGDITTRANTMGAFGCSGGLGADQVYAITPTIAGAITAELHASYAASLLHVRGECFTSATELDCREGPVASVPVRATFPVEAQQTYFIFVDSDKTPSAAGGGLYTLDVTLAAATCGNGVLESPEECDDGNTTAGDGCAAGCTLEPPPAGIDTCPGAPVTLVPGASGAMTFKTTASTASLTSGVKSCGQTDRKDAVYTFVAPFDGWAAAKAKGSFNLTLDLRTNCLAESAPTPNPSGSIACGKQHDGDDEESAKGAIVAGTTYWVIVDGGFANTNKEGPFSLELAMTPSVCGNGVIEGGEDCDDGALLPNDGCDPTCKLEPVPPTRTTCANAEAIAFVESATNPGVHTAVVSGGNWNLPGGGFFSAPCAGPGKEAYFTVTPPISGTLVARVDATYNVSIGARPSCPPNTGTGFLTCSNRSAGAGGESFAFGATAGTTYWIIVDAAGANERGSFTLDVTVRAESCGDGLVSGSEGCDDGNTTNGDGCSATCTLEALAGTDACPGYAVALTGSNPTATREKLVTLSTSALLASYGGTCGGSGRDAVVAVTSDIAGTLTAQLLAPWPTVFYARALSCTDASTELACEAFDAAKPHETTREITVPIQPATPIWLFVDGVGAAAGAATLSLTVTP